MRVAHPRAVLVGLALSLSALALSACGSSSSSSSISRSGGSSSSSGASSSASTASTATTATTATTASTAGPGPSSAKGRIQHLEHALRAARTKPVVTAATCQLETVSESRKSPFGSTGAPVYSCSLTAGGVATAYDIQLLASGCFVAERVKPGKAIYGCGAGKI